MTMAHPSWHTIMTRLTGYAGAFAGADRHRISRCAARAIRASCPGLRRAGVGDVFSCVFYNIKNNRKNFSNVGGGMPDCRRMVPLNIRRMPAPCAIPPRTMRGQGVIHPRCRVHFP
jgi:hypothetical protein